MVAACEMSKWHAIASSVRGSRHVRTGAPNQDAEAHWCDGEIALVCVADGHGSAQHHRSDVGASLAVEVGISALRDIACAPKESRSELLADAPQRIVQDWRSRVDAHLARCPIQTPCDDPYVVYGATLLASGVSGSDLFFLQLGDGDILCVYQDGKTIRPLPPDDRLIANETTSLCMDTAASEFRLRLIPEPEFTPAVITVSTDGYSNSFRSDGDFLQIGPDYLQMLNESGDSAVQAELPAILEDTTSNGSGDDITLAILYQDAGRMLSETHVRVLRNDATMSARLRSALLRAICLTVLLLVFAPALAGAGATAQ